jgi:hypothetical protein
MPRPGPIHVVLADDHVRLESLLDRATAGSGELGAAPFEEFRSGILRHIALEEKVLLPAARRANGGTPLPMARRLRVDHGAIAMLLVPTPSRELVGELRSILAGHNVIEEGPEGLYELSDRLLAGEVEAVLDRLRRYPPVKVAPHFDGPGVCRTAEEALRLSSLQGSRAPSDSGDGASG